MKKMTGIGMVLLCAGALLAQDGPEKTTVPLSDPSRPARIHVQLIMGGIEVRGADIKNVVVEAHSRSGGERQESHPARADGMKRLELPGNAGLDVVEDNNVVNVKTASWNRPVDLLITVPRRSSLQLKCLNDGDIEVEQVDGEIDADDLNGKITLKHVSGFGGGAFLKWRGGRVARSGGCIQADVVQHNERRHRCYASRKRESKRPDEDR